LGDRSDYTGLICGSSGGIGRPDAFTERIDKRAAPLLAFSIVFGLLIFLFTAMLVNSPFFSQILAFASGTIGAIIGFYFSTKTIKP